MVVSATYQVFKTQEKIDRQTSDAADKLRSTQASSFPLNCPDKVDRQWLSPNGNWLAYICGEHVIDQALNVVSRAGKQWTLPYKNYLPEDQLVDVRPGSKVSPTHWMGDDYLYFTPRISGDWWGTCLFFAKTIALYRLDLKDGTITTTLPQKAGYTFYDFAFSPIENKLAYIKGFGGQPVIRDLATGAETRILTQQYSVGSMTWSPDGKELAYLTCEPNQDKSEVAYSSLRIYSLEQRASKTILEAINYNYEGIGKGNGGQYLKIYNAQYKSYFYYIWSTGELIAPLEYTPQTPTPGP